jgi:hypothetical protein
MAIGENMAMIATIVITTTTNADQYALSPSPNAFLGTMRNVEGIMAERGTVEVVWPSGVRQRLNDARANQFLEVREPERP